MRNLVGALALVLGPALVIVGGSFLIDHFPPERPNLPCYSVTDSQGVTHRSDSPPVWGDLGFYWERKDAWGIVQDPVAWEADKDCLRSRGVPVDGE